MGRLFRVFCKKSTPKWYLLAFVSTVKKRCAHAVIIRFENTKLCNLSRLFCGCAPSYLVSLGDIQASVTLHFQFLMLWISKIGG